MTTTIQITESVQDGILKALEAGQRLTVDAARAVASTIDGVLPELPALPFAGVLPSPKEAVDTSFRFAERLLAVQRSFISDLVELGGSPAASPAKKASQAA